MRNIFGLIALVLIFEVIIFLKIASSLGSLNTIILAISTTVIGALILRGTSRKIVEKVKEIFLLGANPAPQIASEFIRLLAILLLLLPGFLSDFMGLLLHPVYVFWCIYAYFNGYIDLKRDNGVTPPNVSG